MVSELKKSIQSTLYERIKNPFFGTLVVSWILWNWRIIYVTLFISESNLKIDKIEYIKKYCSDKNLLILGPLVSTLLLLTCVPFISIGAYKISLYFNSWTRRLKNKSDNEHLITLVQSIELREQINNQDKKFEKLLEDKNNEINSLNTIIDNLKKPSTTNEIPSLDVLLDDEEKEELSNNKTNSELIQIFNRLQSDKALLLQFTQILALIQTSDPIAGRRDIPSNSIAYFEAREIISAKGNGTYELTAKGKQLTRFLDENNLI